MAVTVIVVAVALFSFQHFSSDNDDLVWEHGFEIRTWFWLPARNLKA